MTANITYSVKTLYKLVKELEAQLYPVVLRAGVEQRGYNSIYENAINRFFNEYKKIYGFVKMPAVVFEYKSPSFTDKSGRDTIAAVITKDLIQQAIVQATYLFSSSGDFTVSDPVQLGGYDFYDIISIEKEKEVVEKTIVVKENNTDEILKAITQSQEQASAIKEWLPGIIPQQKEYDQNFGKVEDEVKKVADQLQEIKNSSQDILNKLQQGVEQLELSLQKMEGISSEGLQQLLAKEYTPSIQVQAPGITFPEIPAPQVTVNIKEVITELNASLRAMMAQINNQFDKISQPKETTFKVVYNADQWPVEVVVKENN